MLEVGIDRIRKETDEKAAIMYSFFENSPHFSLAVKDSVFRSPSIRYATPVIQEAIKFGVRVSSQTELFLQLAPCKVIGVTGTKGKSTTAAMIAHLLNWSIVNGQLSNVNKIYLAGNIGKDPFEFLDQLEKADLVVLELSSFQLQGISISPPIAVVTRVTADHLDHHQSLDEYFEAKINITRFQASDDYLIINTDEPVFQKFQEVSLAKIIEVSGERELTTGVYVEQGSLVKIRDKETEEEGMVANEANGLVKGKHNLENWALACGVGNFVFKISISDCQKSFFSFHSLPYRLQFLGTHQGINFYNDSYSTNPDSTVAALKSFPKTPLILICGGSKKSADFSQLAQIIAQQNVEAVIGIGQEGPRILEEVNKIDQGKQVKLISCKILTEAFKKAIQLAKENETILLSPACASFGEFKNAAERGEVFSQLFNDFKEKC